MKGTAEVFPVDLIDRMASAITPGVVPDGLQQRLADRLALAIAKPASTVEISRAADCRWATVMPGVEIRILHHNPTTRTLTSLWRLQPGAALPAHPHDHADEECLILEGDIRHADDVYQPGDYMIGRKGSTHGVISSKNGGVMLLRSSDHHLPRELLA